jgi:hypothetical protein
MTEATIDPWKHITKSKQKCESQEIEKAKLRKVYKSAMSKLKNQVKFTS